VQYYDVQINSSDLVTCTSLEWQLFVLPFIINVGKVVTVVMLSCWVLDTGIERLIGQVWNGQKESERSRRQCALNSILMLVHKDTRSFFYCCTKHDDSLHLPAHPMTAAMLRSLIPGTYCVLLSNISVQRWPVAANATQMCWIICHLFFFLVSFYIYIYINLSAVLHG
jgi:hypothetical protein